MKLAISNIAWDNSELDEHLKLVKRLGCQGIELAPSCIWSEPVNTSDLERKTLKEKIKEIGLEIVGLHALLFTKPELELFASTQSRLETGEYLKKLFKLCQDLGGKTLIFGSPKNRKLNGKSCKECLQIAVGFFKTLMSSAQQYNVILCIEPLSIKESDFITSSEEAISLIESVSHTNFGLHLDAKAMIEANEDFETVFRKYGKLLRHFHVGDSGLTPPGSMGFNHKAIGDALCSCGYKGFVSIEMRRGFDPSREIIEKSINYVKDCYGII